MISGSFHTYNLPWMDVETSLNISFLIWLYWCTSAQKTILLWSICNVFSIRTCYHIHILESPINCMSCWEETRICEGNLTSHHTVRRVLYSYSEDCVAAVNTQTLEPTITQNPDSFKCVCVFTLLPCKHLSADSCCSVWVSSFSPADDGLSCFTAHTDLPALLKTSIYIKMDEFRLYVQQRFTSVHTKVGRVYSEHWSRSDDFITEQRQNGDKRWSQVKATNDNRACSDEPTPE